MLTGLDILRVGLPLKAMSEGWVATIWYAKELLYMCWIIECLNVKSHTCMPIRQQDSWSSFEEEINPGLQPTH